VANLASMGNRRMAEKLKARQAINVSECRRTAGGDYILERFVDGLDYCDAAQEAWVWSIGKLLEPMETTLANGDQVTLAAGTYLASTSNRHYSAGESQIIECVWLR
jgi:hypothetical protein